MKKRVLYRVFITLSLACLGGVILAGAQKKNDAADVQLQAAIHKEMVDGDLEQAIRMYKDIVSKYKNQRTVVAEALLRMAKAYEKLGSTDALRIYEQIVKDFSNEKEASAARTRLGEVARSLESGASLTTRRLWTVPTLEADLSQASVTPNGDWIVFRELRTANLVMRRLSTGETKVLQAGLNSTGPDAQTARSPLISPDSRYVAYRWYPGGLVEGARNLRASDLRVAPLEPAGKPKILIPATPSLYAEPVGWANDGKSVLAMIWNTDGAGAQIAWVSVQDGSTKVLRTLWRRRPGRPSLSPDGRYIAYSAFSAESTWPSPLGSPEPDSHIYVLRADGSQETDVVNNTSINEAPVWTRDGSHILFTSNRRQGSFDLWSVKLGEGKASGTPISVEPNIGRVFPVGVTKSDALLYTNRLLEGDSIFTIDFKSSSGKVGTSQVQLTENSVGTNRAPSWSPDGRFIAFKRRNGVSANKFDLVVRTISSGEEKTFNTTLFEMGSSAPVWFHDSQALALAGPGGTYHRLDPDTGGFTAIAQGRPPLNYSPTLALSPDDKFLYVAAGSAGNPPLNGPLDRIVAFDLNSKQQKDLFSVPARIGAFALSPNGKTFAIVSANMGGGVVRFNERVLIGMGAREPVRLSVIGVDGSGQRDLYGPFSALERPGSDLLAWTSDSRAILFGEMKANNLTRVMRITIDGGKAELTGLDVPGAFHQLSLSPDNSRIAFGMTHEASWELSEISNITTAVRRPR